MPDWFIRREDRPPCCALCDHEFERRQLTKHHLVPKSRGGRETVLLCKPCHSTVHKTFTEKELERDYATVEALRDAKELQVWLTWIRKRKPGRRIRVR
ncbi:MAG: HNH endonuclease [Planctomycetota bacterium]